MRHRCGSKIPIEAFVSPNATEVPFQMPAQRSALPEWEAFVPAKTFDALVAELRPQTAAKIFSILASAEAVDSYGPFPDVVRDVAEALEAEDSKRAFELHLENWNRTRDSWSLGKLPRLALLIGDTPSAVRFFQIAKCFRQPPDISDCLHLVDLPEGRGFVEAVLAETLKSNPFDAAWIADQSAHVLLEKSKKLFSDGVPDDTDGLVEYLRNLEFRALSLLDANSFKTYVRTLSGIVRAFPKGASDEILASYALSTPSAVANAGFQIMNSLGAGILDQIESSNTTVSHLLFRRMSYALHYFSTPTHVGLIEGVRIFFESLPNAETAAKIEGLLESIGSMGDFYNALPANIRSVREELLAEVARTYDATFYDRLAARKKPRSDSIKRLKLRNLPVSVLLLSDEIACGVGLAELSELSEQLLRLPVSPLSSAYLGFVFAEAGHMREAVKWLSKAGTLDLETVSLLLRIVAEYPETVDVAMNALAQGFSIHEKPANASVLAILQAFAKTGPDALSHEMCGDAELAFWNPESALRHYFRASREGNDVSLRKSANLLYGLGRFAEAHELYERLFSEGKDRSVAGRLCLCSLQSGNRTAAEEYFLSLDPTKIEHAEAYAAFHFVPSDGASVSAGLSFIAMFPRSVFLEFPKSLQDAYLDFAKRRIQTLPKFRNGMDPRELAENFWDSFGALRAFSAVLSDDVSNAVAYFRFLRSMFSVGFSESAIGIPVAEIFIETLRPIHGVSFSGSYSEPQDSATRQALIFNLFRQEAETFAIDFFESSLTDTEAYVEMLLGISAIFEDFGNRPLAAEYRIRASETMDGDISGPHGAGNATVH